MWRFRVGLGSGLRSKRSVSRSRTPLPRTGAPDSGSAGLGLAAQTDTLDERAVALYVFGLQVAQQPAPPADELQQTPLGVEVVLVSLHVLRQVVDAPGQQRDLNLRRAGVARPGPIFADDLLLDGGVERH